MLQKSYIDGYAIKLIISKILDIVSVDAISGLTTSRTTI